MHLSVCSLIFLSVSTIDIHAFTSCNHLANLPTVPRKWSSSLHQAFSKKDDDNEEEQEKLVTKEMFLRDMLSDPESVNITEDNEISTSATVRRKKKNGSRFRTLDNRDSLPFLVKVNTPDPYTNNAKMKKEARLNTKRHKNSNKNKKGNVEKTRQNLIGMGGQDFISSSIYARDAEGSMNRIVGEFALDKSTNCGDIIEIGDGTQYQVQKARCQYKYAGGKRFVMTRKILEVKEIKRILVEKEVQELFEKDINDGDESFGNDGLM